jgi:AraC family transcriptional activator of pobA
MNEILELKNPVSGNLSFRVSHFTNDAQFKQLNSLNYFTVIIALKGTGGLVVDSSAYKFGEGSLMAFSLYQPFRITFNDSCEGYLVAFHPDFFCLHKHRKEVSCNGIVFNNIYESPLMKLADQDLLDLLPVVEGLLSEMARKNADAEVILSYLKILLINATRIKVSQRDSESSLTVTIIPDKLVALQSAIETNYTTVHNAAAYAEMISYSQGALNKTCKEYFNKTLSNLIADRIILEAKRELYLTAKPVKAISYDLGFTDEFHFSRYFKRNIGVSPQSFRDTVGVGKATGD